MAKPKEIPAHENEKQRRKKPPVLNGECATIEDARNRMLEEVDGRSAPVGTPDPVAAASGENKDGSQTLLFAVGSPQTPAGGGNTMSGNVQPMAMAVGDLALLMVDASDVAVTPKIIQGHIAAGVPANTDGTIDLVHYAAWLVKEMVESGY